MITVKVSRLNAALIKIPFNLKMAIQSTTSWSVKIQAVGIFYYAGLEFDLITAIK